ncbi:homeodomain-like protein [Rhizophagus clarus]|uniref:Homeodomain-like protein n=1 Tax=Rhizophagus clarus TaxID=94130 RepID=A0A8H3LTY4_9GLOM|nr:homeodomain-like protein [Rhizophagus clarus]
MRIITCYQQQWKCVVNPLIHYKDNLKEKNFNGTHMKAVCFFLFILFIILFIYSRLLYSEIIEKHPDYYLDEIVGEMTRETGKELENQQEKNELLRADYIYTFGTEYQVEQLIFLDESAKDERTLSRSYGYSYKNQVVSFFERY